MVVEDFRPRLCEIDCGGPNWKSEYFGFLVIRKSEWKLIIIYE